MRTHPAWHDETQRAPGEEEIDLWRDDLLLESPRLVQRPCPLPGTTPTRQSNGVRKPQWVLDADIEACFDSIDHTAVMNRVRARVKDKRVLALVKAFLKAG